MGINGVQAGSAFLNSFMQSYNRSLAMQADITKFKHQQKRSNEAFALQEKQVDMQAYKTYTDLKTQEGNNSQY